MMPSQWITLAAIAVIFVPTACIVAALAARARRRALRAEIAAVRANRYDGAVARERFAQQSWSIRRSMLRSASVVGAVGYLSSFFLPLTLVFVAPTLIIQFAPWPGIPVFPTGIVTVVLLSVVVISLYDLLSGLLVEPQAAVALGDPPFTAGRAFARCARRLLLLYLPPLAVIEAVGLFAPALGRVFTLPGADLGFLALGAVVSGAFAARAWLTPSAPLEQTAWAALAPRVREWARLAGVDLRDVRVRFAARLRIADGAVRGRRHPTLYVSDLFLANSDWRQQDALVTQLLGLARERTSKPLASLVSPALVVLCLVVIFGSGLLIGPLGWVPGRLLLVSPILLVAVEIGVAIVVTAAFIYLVYSLFRYRVFGRTTARAHILAADRFSVSLTGDPLALAIALHTLARLHTAPRLRLSLTGDALTADRFAAIERMLSLPGPRASWADQPVPAIVTVATGPHAFTVPLDQAPPPVPVPVAPRGETPPGMSPPRPS